MESFVVKLRSCIQYNYTLNMAVKSCTYAHMYACICDVIWENLSHVAKGESAKQRKLAS